MTTDTSIKTHSERVQLCQSWKYCGDAADIDLYRAEIAELRAALAAVAATQATPEGAELPQQVDTGGLPG